MIWRKPKYLSWYKEPRWKTKPTHLQIEYLFKNTEGDWEYTFDKNKAFKFETRTEALKLCPSYDGSSNIEERIGVMMI